MVRSPFATRLTKFGVRNMDNGKPFKDRSGKVRYHKATDFKPGKSEQAHYANYLAMTA